MVCLTLKKVSLGCTDWLAITSPTRQWLSQQLDPSMNINFSAENLSAVWNYFESEHRCYSWLLRFEDKEKYLSFQTGFSRLMWESLNEEKWEKVKGVEKRYINEAYEEDVEMLESVEDSEEQEQERVRRDDEEAEVAAELEEYHAQEDEEEEEVGDTLAAMPTEEGDNERNTQLTVGYKFDRSFVVRGNRIGVFKHTEDDQLEFSTTINNVATPSGKLFNPKKVSIRMLETMGFSLTVALPCTDHVTRPRFYNGHDGPLQQSCTLQDGSRVWKSGG